MNRAGTRAKRAFGDDGARLLGTLLETTGKLALEDPAGPIAARAEPFFGAATSFDRLLDERRLPYFVDADLIPAGRDLLPLLVAFYVEREERVEAAGTSVRAVHLVRIDSINLRQASLGYTRPRTPAALVLLDQIESDLVRYYADEPAKRVPRSELGEWDDLHEELLRPDVLGAFVAARDRYAASVQRHEVQHRLDFTRELIPVPEPLRANLGLASALDAPEGSLAARSRDELSAYLAELARPDDSPVLDLLLLSRFVLDGGAAADAYWYASVTAFQGIARELGLDPDALLGRGAVRRERFAKLVLAVLEKSPTELRDAAARYPLGAPRS